MEFHRIINWAIDQKGIKQTAIASALGITPPSVHAIVTGKNLPKPDKLDTLAKTLQLNDAQRIKFITAYNTAKGNPKQKTGTPRKPEIETICKKLEARGIEATRSPNTEPGDPELYFNHKKNRYGAFICTNIIDWDTLLGMSLRACQEKDLHRVLLIFTTNSGAHADPETGEVTPSPKELLKKFNVTATSTDGLEQLNLDS